MDKITLYEDAIRRHRDQKGDDRCWIDDALLYSCLPEGYTKAPPAGGQQLCPEEMLENCKKFIASRHDPSLPYVSDRREIEDLREYIDIACTVIAGLLIEAGFPPLQDILHDDVKYERIKVLKEKLYPNG